MLNPARIKVTEEKYNNNLVPKLQFTDFLVLRLLYLKDGSKLFENLSKHEAEFVAKEINDPRMLQNLQKGYNLIRRSDNSRADSK